ncbi:MAG: SdpI family protein [Oscillospiraceae bacterium]
MKRNSFVRILIWLVAFLPLLITLAVYSFLPELIPMHWGVNGKADSYAPRIMAFFTAALPFALLLIYELLPKLDPKRKNYDKFKGAYNAIFLSICFFLLFTQCISLYAAFCPTLNISKLITMLIGVLMCIMGNFMPKFRHNYFCGIRTPWTLASEDCWHRTHRFGAIVMIISGMVILVCSFVLSSVALFISTMAIMLLLTVAVTLYSYLIYKPDNSGEN